MTIPSSTLPAHEPNPMDTNTCIRHRCLALTACAAVATLASCSVAPSVNRVSSEATGAGGTTSVSSAATDIPLSALRIPHSPNIIFILVDDMGYGDIQPYGSTKNRTPHLNRMAAEGMKFTSYYTAPLCTASRTQSMTGCYAKRVSMPMVLGPGSGTGLSLKEHTIAELLKKQGYATMMVGKWHLGDQPKFLPTKRGFDAYLGLPYSNDMDANRGLGYPPLPLIRDDKPVEIITPEKQDHLEERYTEAALKFIREQAAAKRPFFFYFAHTAVHVPIHPGPKFKGKSANGRYGDWVEEVDWTTGRILDTLRELNIADNTLVFFASDNGPWLTKGKDAGTAFPLRGGKGGTYEGGVREPAIAWWPGKIPPATTIDTIVGSIDLLPTFVALAGGTVPPDNKIDGADITPILLGKTKESPRKTNYYFYEKTLEAVRCGPWKLAIAPQDERTPGFKYVKDPNFVPRLYNLDTDIAERHDVAAANPAIVKQLLALVAEMDNDLGIKTKGPGVRPAGKVDKPVKLWLPGQEPPKKTTKQHYD